EPPDRSRNRAPPHRRARDARAEDQGQPRRDGEQATREPRLRSPRRVCRRSEQEMRSALLLLVLAACREHEVPPAGAATTPAPATPRIPPRTAPGSSANRVKTAKQGVVSIHAANPVKSGPAAMFPGAPETTADVALGTGFLIEAKSVYVVTNDHIAS